ncbi:hypothetical protein M3Y94_01289300 [Aphelenchoides besseyi]|nr:hypothetical protein M3Y94_01289300 [Aphelenchoides besseyi]
MVRYLWLGKCETGIEIVCSISSCPSQKVSRVGHTSITWCSLLRSTWLWENSVGQSDRPRISSELHFNQRSSTLERAIWRVRRKCSYDFHESHSTRAVCAFFFKELDSIAKQRGGDLEDIGKACDRVFNEILRCIDCLQDERVLVCGAIASCSNVNYKLLSSRLPITMYVPPPDEEIRLQILEANLRKIPVAKDIDLGFLARSTAGFSGADLTEICQRTCKLAIRESIEKDIEAEKERKKRAEKGEELIDSEAVDPLPEITRAHFEEVMKFARRSLTNNDIRKYEVFAQTLQQSRGFGNNFKFPEQSGSGTQPTAQPAAANDDELYS